MPQQYDNINTYRKQQQHNTNLQNNKHDTQNNVDNYLK